MSWKSNSQRRILKLRNALHKFLSLNPQHHVDNAIGMIILGGLVAVTILSVVALFLGMADAGVFSGPL